MKQKLSYLQWKAILNKVARNRGYVAGAIRVGFDDTWLPLYKKGLTPLQAWNKV